MDRPMISSPILREPTDVSKRRTRFIIFPYCISKTPQLDHPDRLDKDTLYSRIRLRRDVTGRQQGSLRCTVKTKHTGGYKSNFTSRALNRLLAHKIVPLLTFCAGTPCQSRRSTPPFLCPRDSVTARAPLVRTVMSLVARRIRQAQTVALSHEPPSKDVHTAMTLSSASW